MQLSGLLSGLCWIYPPYFLMTLKYCSSLIGTSLDLPLLILSSAILDLTVQFLQTLFPQIYAKCLAKSSLGITLLLLVCVGTMLFHPLSLNPF